jgi:uncharacterized membrane protein
LEPFSGVVPVGSALLVYNLHRQRSKLVWLIVLMSAATWFLFFPNAPYLITDMIHLRARPGVPFWYDLLMLAAFACTGLFLGLISLLLMQEAVRRLAGSVVSWLFALAMLALGSVGIYVGRFLRWNSWDVVFSPQRLVVDVAGAVRHPFLHVGSIAFSVLFAFFLAAMYLTLKAVMNFQNEARQI